MVDKLGLPSVQIDANTQANQPYFLFTYTDGLGDIPAAVIKFIKKPVNQKFLRGVIASGNVNFGDSFCKAADKLAQVFNVPIIRKIDLRGSEEDLRVIKSFHTKLIEGE